LRVLYNCLCPHLRGDPAPKEKNREKTDGKGFLFKTLFFFRFLLGGVAY